MTAAPTYKWQFEYDLWGDRVPKIITLGIASATCVKKGTLMSMYQGNATPTVNGLGAAVIGIAAEDIDTAPTVNDPVKIEVIAPGMVIKGTASSTAASISGFYGKLKDLAASDGTLTPADDTGGGLSVLRTEDSGLTVWCVLTVGAIF